MKWHCEIPSIVVSFVSSCQFIVSDSGDYAVHAADPDKLVDWDLIEQVVSGLCNGINSQYGYPYKRSVCHTSGRYFNQ